jgi:exonuclease VII small subunit
MTKTTKSEHETRYGEAAERLEAILTRIEEGQVDID